MRLQKFIANAGIISRRKAEELILNGKVKVNSEIIKEFKDVTEKDKIEINNKIISTPKKIAIKINKKINFVCTNKKFKNEKNIYELLPKKYHNLKICGRLDKNSTGLVILSNDGDFILQNTHPRYKKEKEYEVEFDKNITNEIIEKWQKPLLINNENYAKCKIKKINKNKIKIILTEGKNRQIRKIAKYFGLNVKNLKRIRIGKIKLDIKSGEWQKIKIFQNKNDK